MKIVAELYPNQLVVSWKYVCELMNNNRVTTFFSDINFSLVGKCGGKDN
jgi:hypothetical protein